jgi:prevent-host-death family protein
MTKQYSIAAARNNLPGLVHEVERGAAVELTRRGRPVAMLISIDEYRRLRDGKGGFWDALQEWRRSIDWDSWDDSVIDGLLEERDRSPGRDFTWPD